MFKVEIIGNLGADAELKESNGSKFVTMRIAHTTTWSKDDGTKQESTIWVDVTLNNDESKVIPYLKQGVRVFVRGNGSLRVYSSKKDRCMKAGLTVSASEIELVGGQSEEVPRLLVHPDSGQLVAVTKYYAANIDTSEWKNDDVGYLVDKKGRQYSLAKGGWVKPIPDAQENAGE